MQMMEDCERENVILKIQDSIKDVEDWSQLVCVVVKCMHQALIHS